MPLFRSPVDARLAARMPLSQSTHPTQPQSWTAPTHRSAPPATLSHWAFAHTSSAALIRLSATQQRRPPPMPRTTPPGLAPHRLHQRMPPLTSLSSGGLLTPCFGARVLFAYGTRRRHGCLPRWQLHGPLYPCPHRAQPPTSTRRTSHRANVPRRTPHAPPRANVPWKLSGKLSGRLYACPHRAPPPTSTRGPRTRHLAQAPDRRQPPPRSGPSVPLELSTSQAPQCRSDKIPLGFPSTVIAPPSPTQLALPRGRRRRTPQCRSDKTPLGFPSTFIAPFHRPS